MSVVRIPIAADASQALSVWDQIIAAIRRAGQEGKKFSEIDLGHPELSEVADSLATMQANFDELTKVGRGADAAAVRKGQYDDVLDWLRRHSRQFTDETMRDKHFRAVSGYVSQGTQAEEEMLAIPPGRSGSKAAPDQGITLPALPALGIGSMLRMVLGMAGVGGLAKMASDGANEAIQQDIELDTLSRGIRSLEQPFDDLGRQIRTIGEGLGITSTEAIKLAQQFARTAKDITPNVLREQVNEAIGFGRGFGVDPAAATGAYAQARWLGVTGDRGLDEKELSRLFAEAISAGNMWSRSDEVMNTLLSWVSNTERMSVDAPPVEPYARMAADMNASGRPGLQGQAGASLISQIDTAIRHGGGYGEASRNFIWQAVERDGDIDAYSFRYLLEKGGMFGTREDVFGKRYQMGDDIPEGKQVGDVIPGQELSTKTTMQLILEELDRVYPKGGKQQDALANTAQISMPQAKAILELKKSDFGTIKDLMQSAKIDLNQVKVESFKELAVIARADKAEMNNMLDMYRRDGGWTRQEVRSVTKEDDLGAMRVAMAKLVAGKNMIETDGSRFREIGSIFSRELSRLGDRLADPLKGIQSTSASLLGSFNRAFEDELKDRVIESASIAAQIFASPENLQAFYENATRGDELKESAKRAEVGEYVTVQDYREMFRRAKERQAPEKSPLFAETFANIKNSVKGWVTDLLTSSGQPDKPERPQEAMDLPELPVKQAVEQVTLRNSLLENVPKPEHRKPVEQVIESVERRGEKMPLPAPKRERPSLIPVPEEHRERKPAESQTKLDVSIKIEQATVDLVDKSGNKVGVIDLQPSVTFAGPVAVPK